MVNSNASSSGMDPEILAAFLDGTLKGKERDQVVRALASSPEHYQALIEAAELRNAIPGPAKVIRIPLYKRWTVMAPAAAAVLAGVLFVSRIALQAGGPESLRLVREQGWFDRARQAQSAQALDPRWRNVEWPAARGVSANDTLAGAAFQAGVLLVNLQFATAVNDPNTVPGTKAKLKDVLANVPGGGFAVAEVVAASDPSAVRELDNTIKDLFGDSPWYNLGIWLGQARLAAAAGDLTFVAPDAEASKVLKGVRDQLAVVPAAERDAYTEATLVKVNMLLELSDKGGFNSAAALTDSLQSTVNSAAASRDEPVP